MKPTLERVRKNLIITYDKNGNSEVFFYHEDKDTFLELEKRVIYDFFRVSVKEVVFKKELDEEKVIDFKKNRKEKDDNHSFYIERNYENGMLVEENNTPSSSIRVWVINDKCFLNFDDAHEYGKQKIKGYNYVDVVIIERRVNQLKEDKITNYPVYEFWVDGKFHFETEDTKRIKFETSKLRLARSVKKYKREKYEVWVGKELDSKHEIRQKALTRWNTLRRYISKEQIIKVVKVIGGTEGDGIYKEGIVPNAKEEFIHPEDIRSTLSIVKK